MATTNAKLNIYQRINAVQKKVAYIKKTRNVNKQYMAVGHDDVIKHTRKHITDSGIVITESLIDDTMGSSGSMTSNGNTIFLYQGRFIVSFVNIDDPSDRVEVRVPAHANDTGDKAPGKAMSYAMKYAILKTFMLETGEDDEERIEGVAEPLTEDQIIELENLCEELEFPPEETLKSLAQKVYQKSDISEVSSLAFDDAVRRLKKKKADANRNAKKGPAKKKSAPRKKAAEKEPETSGDDINI